MKLIGETATHHEGDEIFMTQLVEAIAQKSKADVVKFHIMMDINEYFHVDHEAFHLAKDWMFNKAQWTKFIEIVRTNGKQLMLLLNDTSSVKFGMDFNPEFVEIHSVCLNDYKLLNCLKDSINPGTKIVLGVGGTSLYEIENAINFLENENIILMFGFQNYPTKYEDVNFRKIRKIMKLYPDFEFGYADHTAWNHEQNELITLLGAAQGMSYVEKHVTTDYGENRIDWSAAISVEKFNRIKESMDLLDSCIGNGQLEMNSGEMSYSVFGPMKKAGVLNKDVYSFSKK